MDLVRGMERGRKESVVRRGKGEREGRKSSWEGRREGGKKS